MASVQSSNRYSRGYSFNGVNGVNGVNGMNGINGVNGTTSPTTSSRITTKRSVSSATYMTSTSNDSAVDSSAMNLVRSTAQMLEKRGTAELGYGVVETVSRTKFVDVVQYIGNERLSSLPHKGSKWSVHMKLEVKEHLLMIRCCLTGTKFSSELSILLNSNIHLRR